MQLMLAAIVQPPYLPWPGYFDMLRKVDLMVYLDTVRVNLRSFQRRNRIRTPTGWMWLTLPVIKDRNGSPTIRSAKLNDSTGWRKRHWKAIVSSYGGTPYFREHRKFFEEFYAAPRDSLLDVNVTLIEYLARQLRVDTPIRYASDLQPEGAKTELLVDICRRIGASHYISGPTARKYIKPKLFENEGITLEFHEYNQPIYRQRFPGFVPNMSAIDLLFNLGEQASQTF